LDYGIGCESGSAALAASSKARWQLAQVFVICGDSPIKVEMSIHERTRRFASAFVHFGLT
jgi:hypothetical protein